tara:strand:+ start:20206 stop:21267 length:1062 start_codon:yes stop_codon:yes gene_type:complete
MFMKIRQNNVEEGRWNKIHEIIMGASKIVCSTHINADGDGIGSQVAFCELMKTLDKECRIMNPSPMPEEFDFLNHTTKLEFYNKSNHFDWLKGADLAVIFDIGDIKRLHELGDDLHYLKIPILSIDHHPHADTNSIAYMVHDISVAATGELVYDYIKYVYDKLGQPMTLKRTMADGLYVSLLTDTGSFRFSNTSPKAHEIAGELLHSGVKPYEIYERVYENNSFEKIFLQSSAMKTIQCDETGQLAWFIVDRKMINDSGAKDEDVSGFTDLVRSIKGVEVAVMFHEISDSTTRANFRSKGRVSIDSLARELGGGGHAFAAGVTINLPMCDSIEKVVAETKSVIQKTFAESSKK